MIQKQRLSTNNQLFHFRALFAYTALILCLLTASSCAGGNEGIGIPGKAWKMSLSSEVTVLHFFGDLWPSTWGSDDRLYLAFGDGTGKKNCVPSLTQNCIEAGVSGCAPPAIPGVVADWTTGAATQTGCSGSDWKAGLTAPAGEAFYSDFCNHYNKVAGYTCADCMPLCKFTPNGLIALSGSPPEFEACPAGSGQCTIYTNLPVDYPTAVSSQWTKTSSLLAIGDRLIGAFHYPAGTVTDGYLAYSDDNGSHWNVVSGSPWGSTSSFRVVMFFNMGQAYSENEDGYVYALGIPHELVQPDPVLMFPRLLRVRKELVTYYQFYEYYAGMDPVTKKPLWSLSESDAALLYPLQTFAQGSAMYHPLLKRWLFFSGFADVSDNKPLAVLYSAPKPWGPWRKVGSFSGGFIGSLIPKLASPNANEVYFAAAGSGSYDYVLSIGKMEFE